MISPLKLYIVSTLISLYSQAGVADTLEKEPSHDYQVVVERDIRGVPHVLGKRDADAAFGLAYAQAEDHWELIESAIPFYRGNRASYVGREAAATDFLVHWLDIWETIESSYQTSLKKSTKAYLEAFAAGLNYFAALHPGKVNLDVLPVTAKDLVAGYMIQHLLFYGFEATLKELNQPERQREISKAQGVSRNGMPIGSNAFAVAPNFSDDGATRIAINSHQPATGPVAWYEAHIKSEEGLNIMGGLFPASPTVGVGFNRNVAWAATVNKPDLVDVYVLDMDPNDDMKYRVDGEWMTLSKKNVPITVKLFGFLRWTFNREALRSIHGPVLRTDHGVYAVRYSGAGEMRQVEQWLAMSKSRSLDEWRDAMRLHRFASFNFVAADSSGNIMFVHNSMTPKRLPGFDWTQYLPGDRKDLIWTSYLAFDTLPQLYNPASGFVLSANQSPFKVTAEPYNPDPSQFRSEDGFPVRMTNRADRGLELFKNLGPISAKEFHQIKHDKKYAAHSRAGRYIQSVIELDISDEQYDRYHDAQAHLATWNLSTDLDNRGAALGTCIIGAEWLAEQAGQAAPDPFSQLKRCTDVLLKAVGRIDPLWRKVNRHIRGELDLPVAGGPDTLRAIYGLGLEEDGFLTNVAGDGLYYLVEWDKRGTQTVGGIHQFGSATLDTSSVHYSDQAQDYVDEKLHNPLFNDITRRDKVVRRYRP